MKFCQPHWNELRAVIHQNGGDGLVADSGELAAAQMADQVTSGKITPTNVDPLMLAHNMICERAMRVAGMAIMYPNTDGSDRCPICYLKEEAPKHGEDPALVDAWIPGAGKRACEIALEAVSTGTEER